MEALEREGLVAVTEVHILPDGTLVADSGLTCKPPGMLEFRMESGDTYCALFLGGRTLTPDLISELIDTYEFMTKVSGTKIVIGTG